MTLLAVSLQYPFHPQPNTLQTEPLHSVDASTMKLDLTAPKGAVSTGSTVLPIKDTKADERTYNNCQKMADNSDFIWPFLTPYMGVIPNPKMVFIFPIICILVLVFPFVMIYFPKCEGKGNFPKSQIKSLDKVSTY